MQYDELEAHMAYVFSAALQKCGNMEDAEDLTQEVLLTALHAASSIEHVRAWLSAVFRHKYVDMLRRKYRLPTVSVDLVPEEAEPFEDTELDDRPDAAAVRREVAYLAGAYREAIVRHYLYGEKVQAIADDLGVPKGTVLSRLAAGRDKMRKGLEEMEQYGEQSYRPERLDIGCHGSPGFHDEPWSLAAGDLMKQNILIAAYERPATCVDIAKALGIPTAYVEQAVDDLVKSELMQRTGNRVYTDFMILTREQRLEGMDAQIALVDTHYEGLKDMLESYISTIRELSFYSRLDEPARKKLAHYAILHLFSAAIYTALQRIVPSKEEYPTRPDGGSWIAVGHRVPLRYDFEKDRLKEYSYCGERRAEWTDFLQAKSIALHVYDTQPDWNRYEHGPVEIKDDTLAKLLYIIYKGIPFEATGFDCLFLQDIPHLAACGVLCLENGKPRVAIPILSPHDYQAMDNVRCQAIFLLADYLEPAIRNILPQLKLPVPRHLEGRIAECRRYPCYAIPMAMLKKAIERRDYILAGATPPMVLVVEEADGVIR